MKKKGHGFIFSKDETSLYDIPQYVHQSKAPRYGAMLLEWSRTVDGEMSSLFYYSGTSETSSLRELRDECNQALELSERIFFETDPKYTAKFGIEAIERALREEASVR